MDGGVVRLRVRVDEDGTLFLQDLEGLAGEWVTVEIERASADRSRKMRKFYYALVKEIAEHCGETPAEMHQILLAKFELTDDIVTARRHSPDDAARFTEYVSAVVRHAAWLGIDVDRKRREHRDSGNP